MRKGKLSIRQKPNSSFSSATNSIQPPLYTVKTHNAASGAFNSVSQSINHKGERLTEDTLSANDEDSDNWSTATVGGPSTAFSSFTINDRTYNYAHHARSRNSYFFPTDNRGQDRLFLLHHISLLLHGDKLHLTPLENPSRVLDMGTGTCIWAIDSSHPDAAILGINISPIQSTWVPPNVRLEIDDVKLAWAIPPDSLDFVHIRDMDSAIQNWTNLMREAYRTLKPGGWIEIKDIIWSYTSDDGTVTPEYTPMRIIETVHEALKALNVEFHSSGEHHERLTNVGFMDISQQTQKVPIGLWPADPKLKEVGNITLTAAYLGVEDVILYPLRVGLSWDREKIQALASGVRRDLKKGSIHASVWSYAFWARKPTE
ncbi:S-adenosyl-L-methionine-dependent methyltransferase [Lasiosphaeria hispida]|uniref:S-adenosyl-L-methionine-dependent methyltransferase n=1 Tax=Lasiosphaeria hispida TaxID=260671 RepID=A0AAJ0H569_9PEZI|nr:S-adenosyl-L-methionine-dependent methyltransferase [Lasiosphaeria hispida]